jgi:uncharacterized RDD family membrane protein YckC
VSSRQEDTGWWLASDGKWYPPESHPSAIAAGGAGPVRIYGGFWMRVGAWIIDVIILSVAEAILVAFESSGSAFASPGSNILVSVVGVWLYFALLESSQKQATLGKMALGMKVTDGGGNRVTFGRASGRHFGKIISLLTLYVGFLMAGWTARRQALHDIMADTLVVRVSASTGQQY